MQMFDVAAIDAQRHTISFFTNERNASKERKMWTARGRANGMKIERQKKETYMLHTPYLVMDTYAMSTEHKINIKCFLPVIESRSWIY